MSKSECMNSMVTEIKWEAISDVFEVTEEGHRINYETLISLNEKLNDQNDDT